MVPTIRLVLAALIGSLFFVLTSLQASADPQGHDPEPGSMEGEPIDEIYPDRDTEEDRERNDGEYQYENGAAEEDGKRNNKNDRRMDSDTHQDGGHGKGESDSQKTSSSSNEAESGHHGGGDKESKTFSERLISWLGSFHPAVVHIPIGLLLAALIAEFLLMITGQQAFSSIVRYCIWIGALGALLAAPLGWFNAGFQLTDTKEIVTTHRWIGTAAAVWSVILLFVLSGTKQGGGRSLLRIVLLIGAGMVAYNGYLGGLIIHGLDAHAF